MARTVKELRKIRDDLISQTARNMNEIDRLDLQIHGIAFPTDRPKAHMIIGPQASDVRQFEITVTTRTATFLQMNSVARDPRIYAFISSLSWASTAGSLFLRIRSITPKSEGKARVRIIVFGRDLPKNQEPKLTRHELLLERVPLRNTPSLPNYVYMDGTDL